MKNLCFHLNRKLWVTMAMLLVLAIPSIAQKITVTGHVADEHGEDLIGATILEKGTSNGTAADIEGNFTISVPANATLVVSYVGYDPMDVAVKGQTHLNIVMKQNATMLQETVVIGYGSVKKSDATGSVAVIQPDEVEAGISTSAQDLLVGASPGVVVTTNGGDPSGNANIRIRGGASLSASNDPLIVIDGVQMSNMSNGSGANALTMVNPNNIESMTILKDASATAIYGSRASNGVIIITTKKGRKGRPQVTFSANFHVNTARKTMNMMKSDEYASIISQYGNQRAKDFLNQFNATRDQVDADGNTVFTPMYDTDWQKEILRTSFSHDYSLSVGGSAGVVPYRVNASFTDNQGIMKTSSMQRTTAGFTLNPKFFNETLQINATANGSYIRSRQAPWVISSAIAMAPTNPVYYDYPTQGDAGKVMYNGYYNTLKATGDPETNSTINPVQQINETENIGKSLASNGSLMIDYALYWCQDLHFNLNLGYDVSKNWRHENIAQNSIMAWRDRNMDGAATDAAWHELQRSTQLSFYINYKKQFDAIKSFLDVMVGYEWSHRDYFGHSLTTFTTGGYNNNWTDDADKGLTSIYQAGTYNLNLDPNSKSVIGQSFNNTPTERWANQLTLVSFYGRLNYTFDDTYLLTFTLRDDGSSRFSKDNRWSLFPALALAWKINNCKFMEPAQGWLNEFKLRLGWGMTGQQDFSMYFPYLPIYTNSYITNYQYLDPNGSGNWINPLYPQAYNPDLKWEATTTWNVGLDMGFLNNRITLAADWYKRITSDLLSFVPTGAANTANMMWRNIGNMENIGVEVTIGAKPVVTDNFTWNTSLNVGWNKNKITKLQGDGETSRTQAAGLPSGKGSAGLQWHIVGQPAFTYMVYEQIYNQDGDPIEGAYVDQNADGVINEDDLIMYHSKDPKVTMAWNNNFTWKGWDLGISLRASFGNYVYNNLKYENSRIYNTSAAQYQLSNLLSDTFLFNNQQAGTLLPLSNYFVENASFVRCDNITLGYTLQLKDFGSLRIFAAVQNPFVITGYTGMDPEEFSGIETSPYPRPITTTLGLVLNF